MPRERTEVANDLNLKPTIKTCTDVPRTPDAFGTSTNPGKPRRIAALRNRDEACPSR